MKKVVRLLVLCVFALALLTPLSADPISTTTYTFTGTCTVDCEGVGTGTLVLTGYTPGTALDISNLVSFTYTSDFLGTWSPSISEIDGVIPDSSQLPSPLSIRIYVPNFQYFFTYDSGDWCIGNRCASDAGVEGVWAAAAPQGVPEPSTVLLSLAGFGALALLRRKR